MIKLLKVRVVAPFDLELHFSDRTHGVWHGKDYLVSHTGPLLEQLSDPDYFASAFVDAGALCWPNGLELSPARLQALVQVTASA